MRMFIYENKDEIDFVRPIGSALLPDNVDIEEDICSLLKKHFKSLVGSGGIRIIDMDLDEGIIEFEGMHGHIFCASLIS